MKREEREIVNRMVEALLDVSPERRPAALDALCAGLEHADDSATLRAEVQRLLTEDDSIPARLTSLGELVGGISTRHGKGVESSAKQEVFPESVPKIIGKYHVRSALGTGGMGQVFLAEQRVPIRRTVALKLIRPGFNTYDIIARFEAERQALSRMDHPHIARVLDAGLSDAGRPYFAMEYVDGKSITQFADENKLNIPQRLELFAQVCDAVSHAHTKGVIHRDIKPSNVLAFRDEKGNCSVKVIDFGIAKAVIGERNETLTRTKAVTEAGIIVGTNEYMSPEQAAMSPDIDTRTDVYSLGVVLYELLVGCRPFEQNPASDLTIDELRRRVREDDAPRPSSRIRSLQRTGTSVSAAAAEPTSMPVDEVIARLRCTKPADLLRTLRRELEWIPMMALRRERHRRYASPAEMAADVRNYLANRPLIAAPESRAYRTRKFVGRYRAAIGVGVVTLLLLVGGIIGTTLGMVRAQAARKLADTNEYRATRSAYRSAIVAAEVALRSGDSVRLRQALSAAPTDLRGWEWNHLNSSATTVIAMLQREAGDHFRMTTALPDNRRAISAPNDEVGSIVLWELESGRVLRRESGSQFAVDAEGRWIALVRPDGSLELCDLESGRSAWRKPISSDGKPWRLYESSFSASSHQLLAWNGSPQSITIFDCDTGIASEMATSVPIQRVIGFIKEPRDRSRIAFAVRGTSGTFLLDPASGVTEREPRIGHILAGEPLQDVGANTWLPLNFVGAEQPVFKFDSAPLSLWSSVYLPGRRAIASARADGSIEVVPSRSDTLVSGEQAGDTRVTPIQKLVAGSEQVYVLTATPDESRLIITFTNGDVGVVPVDVSTEVNVAMASVESSVLSPDKSKIIGAGWGDVQCVDTLTGLPLWGRNLGPASNRYVAWSPNGKVVIVATDPRDNGKSDVFVLDGTTGEQLAAWCDSPATPDPLHKNAELAWAKDVAGLAFNVDGSLLLVAHKDGTLTRVDPTTWAPLAKDSSAPAETPWCVTAQLESRHESTLKASPDRTWSAQLTTQFLERSVRVGAVTVRNGTTGELIRRVELSGMGATAVAWSPSSDSLAVSFSDSNQTRILVVDPKSGEVRVDQRASSDSSVRALTFTDDGERLIAINRAGRFMVLDARTGDEIMSPFDPQPITDANFTSDGAIALTGGGVLLRRLESRKLDALHQALAADWPLKGESPKTVDEARRAVSKALALLQQAYASSLPFDVFVNELPDQDRSAADLMRLLHSRMPPNINVLNSSALQILLGADPKPQELSQAREMLAKAVAIKPHSANLNSNLGAIAFAQQDFAGCIHWLETAEQLRAQRGLQPAGGNLLRLAIASRSINDPRADNFARAALQAVDEQSLSGDPEISPLLRQLETRGK